MILSIFGLWAKSILWSAALPVKMLLAFPWQMSSLTQGRQWQMSSLTQGRQWQMSSLTQGCSDKWAASCKVVSDKWAVSPYLYSALFTTTVHMLLVSDLPQHLYRCPSLFIPTCMQCLILLLELLGHSDTGMVEIYNSALIVIKVWTLLFI